MTFSPSWRTPTAISLAEQIRGGRWDLCKFLGDALEDAGADGAALAPLRDPGIASPLSGLWLAVVLGRGELWEWGQLELERVRITSRHCNHDEDCSSFEGGCVTHCRKVEIVCSRHEQLRLANTEGRGERWDECRCPCCPPEGKRHVICAACQNSGDLLLRPSSLPAMSLGQEWSPRPLSFNLVPLPVVSVRLEEMVRDERCEDCRGDGAVTRFRGPGATNAYRDDCGPCSGTGVTHVPSAWLAALPPWFDVMLEGVEPMNYDGRFGFPSGTVPMWIAQLLIDASGPNEFFKDSPAAAHTSLRTALRRWRYA